MCVTTSLNFGWPNTEYSIRMRSMWLKQHLVFPVVWSAAACDRWSSLTVYSGQEIETMQVYIHHLGI